MPAVLSMKGVETYGSILDRLTWTAVVKICPIGRVAAEADCTGSMTVPPGGAGTGRTNHADGPVRPAFGPVRPRKDRIAPRRAIRAIRNRLKIIRYPVP